MGPLILTLKLNYEAEEFFSRLRKKHFPPDRNYLDAHLTLFHQLPPAEAAITAGIDDVCSRFNALAINVSKVALIGNGVAYKCESADLQRLHAQLQRDWEKWLIPQDTQTLWPHITIQNKVSVQMARELQQELSAGFEPFTIYGTGLRLWEYRGGPWEFVQDIPLNSVKAEV